MHVDYSGLVFESFLELIRKVLAIVGEAGAPYESGILIKFQMDHPDLVIPDAIRAEYPETMSIILQHMFDDLEVEGTAFSVTLFFNGAPARLTIPLAAITSFEDLGRSILFTLEPGAFDRIGTHTTGATTEADNAPVEAPAEIIRLDSFRKTADRTEES